MTRFPNVKNGNNEVFSMRISKAMKDKLNRLAKRHGGSASSAIRYMIEYHFKR